MPSPPPNQPVDRSPTPLDGDEAFLDRVFEAAVQRLEAGKDCPAAELTGGREDLRPQIEEVIALARQVAPVRARGFPVVPGYMVLSEIGSGSMGEVFVARQERMGGRLVALKVLPGTSALSARARERFGVESAAIARLGHANIVKVFDVVEAEDVHAYAMELVDGTTLADRIRAITRPRVRGRRRQARGSDPGEMCRIGVAIGRALGAVHAAGLLHRDVKPSNILLRPDGVPLLTDFGLVRDTSSTLRTEAGQFVGTAAYSPPEQLRGREIDARADVYALGATLFHALTGRLAWTGTSPGEILRQMEDSPAPRLRSALPGASRDLETVLAKAMDLEPARRYASADDLADDLQRVLDVRPIAARPVGVTGRTIKALRRHRRAVLGASVGGGVVLLVAIGALLWWFLLPRLAAAEMRSARLALLDPSQADAWFAGAHLGDRTRMPVTGDHGLSGALAHYRAAQSTLRASTLDRLEYEAVAMAGSMRRGETARASASFQSRAPAAARYASLWTPEALPAIEELLDPTTSLDRRTLGLLAALCGDMVVGIRAWEGLPLEADPDPLVEAALAQHCLATDQDARALSYAASAHRAFGEVGFLCVKYADAAVRAGDLELATRLLDRARSLGGHDTLRTMDRVDADLSAASAVRLRAAGQGEEADALDTGARAQYEYFRNHRINGSARDRYGRFLAARGELREAAQVYAEIIRVYPTVGWYHDKFRDAADLWWGSLPPRERLRELGRMLDGDPYLYEFLFIYSGGLGVPPAPRRRPPGSLGSSDRTTPDAYLADISLAELAHRVRVLDLERWGHAGEYPPGLRLALPWLWALPLPDWVADGAIAALRPESRRARPLAAWFTETFDGEDLSDELYAIPRAAGRAVLSGGGLELHVDAGNLPGQHRADVRTRFVIEGDFELSVRSPLLSSARSHQVMALQWPRGGGQIVASSGDGTGGSFDLRPARPLLLSRPPPGTPRDRPRIRRIGRILLLEHHDPARGWVLQNLAYGNACLSPARVILLLASNPPVDAPDVCEFDDLEIRAERLIPEDHLPEGFGAFPR